MCLIRKYLEALNSQFVHTMLLVDVTDDEDDTDRTYKKRKIKWILSERE